MHERGRVREALVLVSGEPSRVSAAGEFPAADGGVPPVDCARLRRMAAKAGEFEEGAKLLGRLVSLHLTDAPAELEALQAGWAERRGDADGRLRHAERAAELRPASWEFARRAAEIRMARNEAAQARTVIAGFLSVSQSVSEREAAFDFWEKASDAMRR